MKKITYTKNQLMKLTLGELQKLPLFSLVTPTGLTKKDLVDKMFEVQTNGEVPNVDVPITTPIIEEVKVEETISPVVENNKKELGENKANKQVVFHRGKPLPRNPMSFR